MIISQQGGHTWPLSSRYPQSAGRPFLATIQSRFSVSREAFLGRFPVEIHSQWGGLSWPLSSRDLQSTGWPFLATNRSRSSANRVAFSWLISGRDLQSAGRPLLATIQSRSLVRWVAFIGYYPVEIFSRMGGLYLPLSFRDLQSIPLLVGLWCLPWDQPRIQKASPWSAQWSRTC